MSIESGGAVPAHVFAVDLASSDRTDPFPFYEQLRAEGPVLWDPNMKSWLILDFEMCRKVENDEEFFYNSYRNADPVLSEIKGGQANITVLQGEEHDRMRRFHLKLLSPSTVESYRTLYIRPILDFLLGEIVAKGKGDLTAELADQLPPRLTAALFGMPWQDDVLIHEMLVLHEDIMTWIGRRMSGDKEVERKAKASSDRLNEILRPYIEARRTEPKEDFISRVWADAAQYYDRIESADVLAICRELFLAGSDTTTHGIANALYLVLADQRVRSALDTDVKASLNATVEEALRLFGSVQYRVRFASEECELGGKTIAKDDCLILLHAAANRDPAVFACPHDVDLARKPSNKHLAFNSGPRSCVGAFLARIEMRECIERTLTYLPGVRLDPSAEPPRFDGFYMRSWRPLNVVFDRG